MARRSARAPVPLLAALLLVALLAPAPPAAAQPLGGTVVRVVDGDTIHVLVEGRVEKVRYIGVNTPEVHHPTKGEQPGGREATAANRALVLGKRVRLELDVQPRDRYGHVDCTKPAGIFREGSFNRPEEVTDGGEPTSGWTRRVQGC